MGDKRRFSILAEYLWANFPPSTRIADVAGGKGYLQQALRERGFSSVVTFDKRKGRRDRPTLRYQYRYFGRSVPNEFDLIVGLHPDAATDLIIVEAARRGAAFVVVPCCIMPSAAAFWGTHRYADWLAHLKALAGRQRFQVSETMLRFSGRNVVLAGRPERMELTSGHAGRWEGDSNDW